MGQLLALGKKEIKKEACWMLSNVTAGDATQIDAVCASGLVPSLIRCASEEEYDIKKEAVYALCNAIMGGSPATVSGLVYMGALRPLCALLEAPDTELVFAILEGVGAALEAGERSRAASGGVNRCVELVDEAGGCDRLEALQLHENQMVYTKAAQLLDEYFMDGAEAEEDPQIAPVAHADAFAFSATPTSLPPGVLPQGGLPPASLPGSMPGIS